MLFRYFWGCTFIGDTQIDCFDHVWQQDVYSATNPPYYEDKERQRGDNEVIDTKPTAAGTGVSGAWGKDCSATALQAMGDRLLDWFSVIMADAKRRRTHNKGKGQYICHVKKQVVSRINTHAPMRPINMCNDCTNPTTYRRNYNFTH